MAQSDWGKRDRQWKERGSVCRNLFGLTDGLGGRNSKTPPPHAPICIRVPTAACGAVSPGKEKYVAWNFPFGLAVEDPPATRSNRQSRDGRHSVSHRLV